jgi:hypothetical protein
MQADDPREHLVQSRRQFLATTANGLGLLALTSLLGADGLLPAGAAPTPPGIGGQGGINPLALRAPHFAPTAKHCIFIFLEGAPSQIDLFDQKPKLRELDGQPLPKSMTENVRFAFIQKETARLMGSTQKFRRYGKCGTEMSELLPRIGACADDIALIRSMHTDQFNHHPGQLMMNSGSPIFGRPSIGSWLNYGLGNESQDLPGYVVLTAGRGTSGGASNWTSGFLPSTYQGVLFRNQGDPVLNLSNPGGVTDEMQRKSLESIARLNRARYEYIRDPEIASRIAAYELAFRMQTAAPELLDLHGENPATLEMYGVGRTEPAKSGFRGYQKGVYNAFSTNCLLARRLVERGVRFVNLYHASWDHHDNLDAELEFACGMADQPVGALLTDLKQRGLLDETLVVWAGEFGRTPLGENRVGLAKVSGRDHHPYAYSIWMAGGGIKGGQVIGETDEIGWNVTKEPVHVNDFHATLLHLFGFDHTRLTYRFQGRDFRLTDVAGNVVSKLVA